MSKNTKPTRKSGKKKQYSREEVLKINQRYQNKLEEFKDKTEDGLTEVLKSKLSSTDKQAAYDIMEKNRKMQLESVNQGLAKANSETVEKRNEDKHTQVDNPLNVI